MPAKKHKVDPDTLTGPALVKEVNRRLRLAMSLWKAHNNVGTRREREKALALYEKLMPEEREGVPQDLRVWLRYRSEKYFGEGRAGNGANSGNGKVKAKPDAQAPLETEGDTLW